MLFDIQGKRRRVVQATYLTLAVLMGGGLLLFGIGGDVSGGLVDAFTGKGGNKGNDNSALEKRVESGEKRLKANPRSEAVRKQLARDYYQLATAKTSSNQTTFSKDAKEDLAKSAGNWKAYLALEPKRPDAGLARVALQVFDPSALNRPKEAQQAALLIAESENSATAYLNLVQYATLATDTRTADLAGQKAIELAPASERKQVRDQVKQAKTPPSAQTGAGGTGAPQP